MNFTKLRNILDIEEKYYPYLAILALVVFFVPYVYLGENSPILIHDNLDSNVVWMKLYLENQSIFHSPNTIIPEIMNGLPQSSLYAGFKFELLSFQIFGMFWGYVFNKFIMALVAFFGFYWLSKKLGINVFVSAVVALLFAMLPFWNFTLSIAGIPLILYLFLTIRDKEDKRWHWIVLFLMPFCTSLTFSIVFFLLILGLYFGIVFFQKKKIDTKIVLSMIVFGLLFLVSEFPLFYSFLTLEGFTTHRTEFQFDQLNAPESFERFWWIFKNGQFHAQSLHRYFYLILIGFVITALFRRKSLKRFSLFFGIILISSLFYGFSRWEGVADLVSSIPVQIDRFYVLHPILWFLLLAISLDFFYKLFKKYKIVILILVFIPFYKIAKHHEVYYNRISPSFAQFYSEDQFKKIKKYINKPTEEYRTISVGLHPAVALYNGMYTVDGYSVNYPLDHKHEFLKVIQGELDKDESLEKYYQNWGSRCYAFSSELGRSFIGNVRGEIEPLAYNYEQLKSMGGEYILSTAKIKENQNIELLKTFDEENWFWIIHLYKVI